MPAVVYPSTEVPEHVGATDLVIEGPCRTLKRIMLIRIVSLYFDSKLSHIKVKPAAVIFLQNGIENGS